MTAVVAIERGKARAVRVSQASLVYLRTPGTSTKERRAELAALYRSHKRKQLEHVRSLVGRVLEVQRSGEVVPHLVTRRELAPMLALVSSLWTLLARYARHTGDVEVMVATTRALGACLAGRDATCAPRTWTRYLPILEAGGVVLYQHGRSRHPSLVAFPALYHELGPVARAAVEGHLRAAEDAKGDARELLSWWAPVCRALLEGETPHAAAELREGYRLEEERAHYEREAARAEAIAERVAAKTDRERLEREAAAAAARVRAAEEAAAREQGWRLEQELRARREAAAARARAERAARTKDRAAEVIARVLDLPKTASERASSEYPRGQFGHRNRLRTDPNYKSPGSTRADGAGPKTHSGRPAGERQHPPNGGSVLEAWRRRATGSELEAVMGSRGGRSDDEDPGG